MVHIVADVSRAEELVYVQGSHPYDTIRALKAALQKVIFCELGPTYGVYTAGDQWLDRNGAPLPLPRRRAPTPWGSGQRHSITCPVGVAQLDDILKYPEHALSEAEETMFGWYIDFEARQKLGEIPRFFDLPQIDLGYPITQGYDLVGALYNLQVSDAATLARAMGFAVQPPTYFDEETRANLANAWFLLVYGTPEAAGTRVMFFDVGWLDQYGVVKGVVTALVEKGGNRGGCAVVHSMGAVGRPGELFPVQILIDRRFYLGGGTSDGS
jgi:hypothetical protein